MFASFPASGGKALLFVSLPVSRAILAAFLNVCQLHMPTFSVLQCPQYSSFIGHTQGHMHNLLVRGLHALYDLQSAGGP